VNQFVVSIILLNVLIAIVSKAYDTSMSKGRSHFLSVRLNIAALYGSMGLTSENKLNIMLHKGRKRVQNSIKRNYPDLWDLFATKRRHQARTPTFRPDEGDDGDSDDEEAARKTRQEIKTVLSNMSSLQSGFRKSQERTSQETVSSLDLLKEEMMALREEVRALREGGGIIPQGRGTSSAGELRPELAGLVLPTEEHVHSDSSEESEDDANEPDRRTVAFAAPTVDSVPEDRAVTSAAPDTHTVQNTPSTPPPPSPPQPPPLPLPANSNEDKSEAPSANVSLGLNAVADFFSGGSSTASSRASRESGGSSSASASSANNGDHVATFEKLMSQQRKMKTEKRTQAFKEQQRKAAEERKSVAETRTLFNNVAGKGGLSLSPRQGGRGGGGPTGGRGERGGGGRGLVRGSSAPASTRMADF
jgi:hypothetical protein